MDLSGGRASVCAVPPHPHPTAMHQGRALPSAWRARILGWSPHSPASPHRRAPRCHSGAWTLGPRHSLLSTHSLSALTWCLWPSQLTPRALCFHSPAHIHASPGGCFQLQGRGRGADKPADRTLPTSCRFLGLGPFLDVSCILDPTFASQQPCGDPRRQPLKGTGQAQEP